VKPRRFVSFGASVLILVAACGGGPMTSPSPAPGPLTFTSSPIDPAALQYIVPLGNMGPWAHTQPTDHIYFYHHLNAGTFAPVPVTAPASGTVDFIIDRGPDSKVRVRVNGTYEYYFDHLSPAPGISVGTRIEAGSRIGDSAGIALDFNVSNTAVRLGFVNPARYGQETLQTDAPLKYFQEPIRSALYGKVRRVGGDLDGRIDFDVAGTLSGNWFAEDLPLADSTRSDLPSVGMRQLAFARDAWFPDRQRVSIGGLGMTGLYGVPPDAPDFTSITASSGVVVYRLLNLGEPGSPPGTDQLGLIIVQLDAAGRLRVEAVDDRIGRTATFSGNARTYVR
jgi:hypothetical protein